jgi:hypothetical protein
VGKISKGVFEPKKQNASADVNDPGAGEAAGAGGGAGMRAFVASSVRSKVCWKSHDLL